VLFWVFLYLSTFPAACASLSCFFSLQICAFFFAMFAFFLLISWCKYFFVVYRENINLSRRSVILDIYFSFSFLAFKRSAILYVLLPWCHWVSGSWHNQWSCAGCNGDDSTLVVVVSKPVTISLVSQEEHVMADCELDINANTEDSVTMVKSSWQKKATNGQSISLNTIYRFQSLPKQNFYTLNNMDSVTHLKIAQKGEHVWR